MVMFVVADEASFLRQVGNLSVAEATDVLIVGICTGGTTER